MTIKASKQQKKLVAYMRLVAHFPLVSIRSEQQLGGAHAVIDRLLAKGKLDAGEVMYLDALSDLVAAYEDVRYPIRPASDAAMLKHLLDAKGINQAELHRQTGLPKSTISEVLSGKKPFSRTMIRTLAAFFQVDSSILTTNL